MPKSNMEVSIETLGTAHQRRYEQKKKRDKKVTLIASRH